ncbi:MAG: hypothetical protein HY316_04780 [Acidobacteria bacterium]|nr:hypothetical protein [Acidobacteriota bacterium]
MLINDLHLHGDQVKVYGELMPLLIGRVFHVTQLDFLEGILTAGKIHANRDGRLPTTFGLGNSYFRSRGCVSLFNLHDASEEERNKSIPKCHPIYPGYDRLAYLFLSPTHYSRLIPWTRWKDENASAAIVPYIEAGYPDSIPLSAIEEILRVTIAFAPNPMVENLLRGRTRRGSI